MKPSLGMTTLAILFGLSAAGEEEVPWKYDTSGRAPIVVSAVSRTLATVFDSVFRTVGTTVPSGVDSRFRSDGAAVVPHFVSEPGGLTILIR